MRMEWSKTKTIFILAFLILDIYLAYEYFQLRGESNYAVIQEATLEERLDAEGIEYKGKLPEDIGKGYYITAKSKDFSLEEISKLKNQSMVVTNSSLPIDSFRTLKMDLKEPFPLPEVNVKSKINQFLRENIIGGELYHYWYTDEETNTIICIQQYKNQNIFQSKEDHIAMVIFYLNEDREIFAYEQSMLEDIKEVEEKETAISPIKALEALYNKNYLPSNSKIEDIQYGFYTHIPLTNQQILAPIWHITVENEQKKREDYYVNALEGDVLQLTE
jgi:regulatory protein YycI of two-component signal transduction system YycFG